MREKILAGFLCFAMCGSFLLPQQPVRAAANHKTTLASETAQANETEFQADKTAAQSDETAAEIICAQNTGITRRLPSQGKCLTNASTSNLQAQIRRRRSM